MKHQFKLKLFLVITTAVLFQACEKKSIQFATQLGETFTTIFETDTVTIDMSTFFTDSFPTNSLPEFAAGFYVDSVLGKITAKPYMQFALPESTEIEANAIYDSTTFVMRLNKNWYGDTSVPLTLTVKELSAPIEYTYSTYLFNTTSISEKTSALGIRQFRIFPSRGDSLSIRLSDVKGTELFNKFKQQDAEILTSSAFLNYFRGLSVEPSTTIPAAVYGINLSADSVFVRLHYHTNTPYHTSYYKDIKFDGTTYFNKIVSERTGTMFSNISELVSSRASGDFSVSQAAAGVLLKMTFPSLRNMLKIDPTLKLLSATLIMQVKPGSFDGPYPLPSTLYLASTDASNTIGNFLADSTGTTLLRSSLVQDNIYDNGTQYRFNLTKFINTLLTTAGSENTGVFLMQDSPGSLTSMNRVVINNSTGIGKRSKLILSLLTLKTQ